MIWLRERWIPIFILSILVFSTALSGHDESQSNSYINASSDSPTEVPEGGIAVQIPIGDAVETPPTQNGQKEIDWETRDQQAQVSMMYAAWAAVGMTFLGLILVARTLHYTGVAAEAANLTLKEAERGADAAWKSFEVTRNSALAANSAYLKIEKMACFVKHDEVSKRLTGNAPVAIEFVVKNVGISPAFDVTAEVDFFTTENRFARRDTSDADKPSEGVVSGYITPKGYSPPITYFVRGADATIGENRLGEEAMIVNGLRMIVAEGTIYFHDAFTKTTGIKRTISFRRLIGLDKIPLNGHVEMTATDEESAN